jgi:dynein heavy chain
VAVIGSVLYFVVIDLGNTNHMYNVSLKQFMKIFLKSIEISKVIKEKGEEEEEEEIDTSVRVQQIYDMLIEVTYKYTMRGLFERDKLSFKIILCMKYLMT